MTGAGHPGGQPVEPLRRRAVQQRNITDLGKMVQQRLDCPRLAEGPPGVDAALQRVLDLQTQPRPQCPQLESVLAVVGAVCDEFLPRASDVRAHASGRGAIPGPGTEQRRSSGIGLRRLDRVATEEAHMVVGRHP